MVWPENPKTILDVPHTTTFNPEGLTAFANDNPNCALALVGNVRQRRQALESLTQGNEEQERLIGNELIAFALHAAAIRRSEFGGQF